MENRFTFDEISPITNNLCVLVDKDSSTGLWSKLCTESGYTTNSFLVEGSKTLEELKEKIPKFVYELIKYDKGYAWVLSMNSTSKASMFPILDTNTSDYKWQVVPFKMLNEEESKNYPNPDKPGEFYNTVVDFENASTFDKGKFLEAFDQFMLISKEDE
jgi:hypothetical protein